MIKILSDSFGCFEIRNNRHSVYCLRFHFRKSKKFEFGFDGTDTDCIEQSTRPLTINENCIIANLNFLFISKAVARGTIANYIRFENFQRSFFHVFKFHSIMVKFSRVLRADLMDAGKNFISLQTE